MLVGVACDGQVTFPECIPYHAAERHQQTPEALLQTTNQVRQWMDGRQNMYMYVYMPHHMIPAAHVS